MFVSRGICTYVSQRSSWLIIYVRKRVCSHLMNVMLLLVRVESLYQLWNVKYLFVANVIDPIAPSRWTGAVFGGFRHKKE